MIRSNDNQHIQRIEVYRPTQDEMQRITGRIEVRRGERNLSIDINKLEQPRVESRTSQVQERQSHRDRQEMRRELIQRYEHKQKLLPPAGRKTHQQRKSESSRIRQSSKPTQGRRSGNKRER